MEPNSPEMDYAAENYGFHERVMHFLRGHGICKYTRVNVEVCILIQAGADTIDAKTGCTDDRDKIMLEKYLFLLGKFDLRDFTEPDILGRMKVRLGNAKSDISGANLYKKFQSVCSIIRNEYLPKLPNNLSAMASGNQLRDTYDQFIVRVYKEEKVRLVLVLV